MDNGGVRATNRAFKSTFAGGSFGTYISAAGVIPPDAIEHGLLDGLNSQESASRRVRRETAGGWRRNRVQAIPTREGVYLRYVDVTRATCRSQQLDVFHRVLRHDLRNKLNIILGASAGAGEPLTEAVEELLYTSGSLGHLVLLEEDPVPIRLERILEHIEREYPVERSLAQSTVWIDHPVGAALER